MIGRTGRKGKPGMVQMILNHYDLEDIYRDHEVKVMREKRENKEKARILGMWIRVKVTR